MRYFSFIRKNAVFFYFSLVFIISWGLIIILAGPENIPIHPEKSKALLPLLYTMMLLGPGIAGILLTGIVNGKEGYRNLRFCLFKWKVGFRWYLVALLTAPVLAIIILFILSRFSSDYTMHFFCSHNKTSILLSGLMVGLMVGIFEELGWSGFVVPRLRKCYTIFSTGLITGLIWGAWHFILFWESDTFNGMLPLIILIGRLFTWLPPFRIFMVWILDRTDSMLIVILTHASLVFTTTVLVPMSLKGNSLLTWLIIWSTALWVVVLAITVFSRKQKEFK